MDGMIWIDIILFINEKIQHDKKILNQITNIPQNVYFILTGSIYDSNP